MKEVSLLYQPARFHVDAHRMSTRIKPSAHRDDPGQSPCCEMRTVFSERTAAMMPKDQRSGRALEPVIMQGTDGPRYSMSDIKT